MKEVEEMGTEEMQEEIKELREALEARGLLIRPIMQEHTGPVIRYADDQYGNVDILRIQIPMSELECIRDHCISRRGKHGDKKCKKCRYRSKIEIDACMFIGGEPCEWR